MSQAKSKGVSVATYADHEVITPPNRLRSAIVNAAGGGGDPVVRAEAALARLAGEFSGWMDEECERLDRARMEVRARGFEPATYEALFHAAHDIKGQAATLGFPWVAALADSLCRLLEHTPEMSRIPTMLADQHVDAVRAVIRERARSDIAAVADALSRRLREVTDEFLVHANRERPDYLDGILAPPPAPGDW
jgi:chemotaxis protein histidine kinase CheA